MAVINIKDLSMTELVEIYNKYSEKQVTRFSDRKTAERRASAVIMAAKSNGTWVEDDEVPTKEAKPKKVTEESKIKNDVDQDNFNATKHVECPHCGINLSNGWTSFDAEEAEGNRDMHKEFACLACGEEFGKTIRRKRSDSENQSISEGVRQSWKVEEIYEKRCQRSQVEVDGQIYRSVKHAFEKLHLPLNEHIKFRMQLKEAGKLKAYDRKWVIRPLNY